jgi:opacity protein-like surface antigen
MAHPNPGIFAGSDQQPARARNLSSPANASWRHSLPDCNAWLISMFISTTKRKTTWTDMGQSTTLTYRRGLIHKGFRMKNLLKFAGLLTLLASSASAADIAVQNEPVVAADPGGFYLGTLNSLTFLDDTGFSALGADVSTDYDLGYYSALRAGYSFGSYGFVSPRLELEVGYGRADVDEHTVAGVGAGGDSFGSASTIQGYVNGYIDVPTGTAFTPYLGGGIGAMNLKLRRQGTSGTGVVMNDDDTKFAYHLDAGVGIELSTISFLRDTNLFANTTFDIGYRYTAADNFDFTATDGTASSTDFSSHAITVGFRRQF